MTLTGMFNLQQKLNDETNGKNWQLGTTKLGKDINWLRCIHMEVAELIDSTPWKHWKNIDDKCDMQNLHIELVDIWHFIMSFALQEKNIPKAIELVNNSCKYTINNNIDYKEIITQSEKLSYIALNLQINNLVTNESIIQLINQFFICCKVSGLSYDMLYKTYIGKNCLNKFRQDHGYKEGNYNKIWNGKEDNVYMTNIIDTMKTVNFDDLYDSLKKAYNNL